MYHGTKADIRPYKHIVANPHLRLIKHFKVEIAYKIVCDMYIESEITMKRRIDNYVIPHRAKQATEHRTPPFPVRRTQ